MKTQHCRPVSIVARLSAILLAIASVSQSASAAGTATWTGGGVDSRWTTSANWINPPLGGENLIFTGTTRLANTNSFTIGTLFNSITFSSPAGSFVLNGNQFALSAGITNSQPISAETIANSLTLNSSSVISVIDAGSLTMSGIISGAGGITKVGNGTLLLSGANTYSGSVAINGGTLSINSDSSLGTTPATATPGKLAVNGGTLQTTATLTLNANRGIALGPTSGSGSGTFDVASGTTLTYAGTMANNGAGAGGLTKSSFGGLTLQNSNTFTGPVVIKNGTVTVDYSQATSPTNGMIPSVASLRLGGGNAGVGTVSYSSLIMLGKTGATNNQAFSGLTLDVGPAVIRATNSVNAPGTGNANLALGSITRNPGSIVVFMPPTNGGGSITTSLTNDPSGILGSWAMIGNGNTINSFAIGTNLASVDINSNIVNYNGYFVYASGTLHGSVTAETNVLITTATGDVPIDTPLAGTTTTVNTIDIRRPALQTAWAINVGTNNTLRLGRYGSIFKQDTTSGTTFYLGLNNTAGAQNVGTITAGGADNQDGDVEFIINNTSATGGSLNVETAISDNGSGKVTVIKAGTGSMKLRGWNTYSGGTYILIGRLQIAQAENGGSARGDQVFGSGPVTINPGGQTFLSGTWVAPTNVILNDFFIAGNGSAAEASGAFRLGNSVIIGSSTNTVTLTGDASASGGNGLASGIASRITGPFSMHLGAPATVNANFAVFNQSNDWSGTTFFDCVGGGGTAIVYNGTNDVIPNGLGKGSVIMTNNNATGIDIWSLNGFNETINGLSTSGGNPFGAVITNTAGVGTNSTLTVGDNNASGTFAGALRDGAGLLSLVKIGGGVETLTGTNLLVGTVTVNAGTLAISLGGAISNSTSIAVNSAASLDVSGMTNAGFATPNTVSLSGGTFIGNTSSGGIGTLTMTDGFLTPTLDGKGTNLFVNSLTSNGTTNAINIATLPTVTSYPTQFTVIKYTTFAGTAPFVFGSRPSLSTSGFISNDVASSRIILVLTNGPKNLFWQGCTNNSWDINTTYAWLGFGVPQPFNAADVVAFDDTACTGVVRIATTVFPSTVTINNTNLSYTFTGSGSIGGGSLLKIGSGTATFLNTGFDSYGGGVVISNGTLVFGSDNLIAGGVNIASNSTVQVGTNGGSGTLPGGSIINNGTLVFNRGTDLAVGNVISGATNDLLIKTNAGILALNAANTFTGAVSVVGGTLQVGNNSALGRTNSGTTISAGATLDVNGANLGGEPITVAGTGVGNNGAIVNTGASQVNALRNVTLSADTTFGGSGRWDIRENVTGNNDAILTGAFNITKLGTNQVSLVGVTVGSLGNINVGQGTFGIERGTTLPATGTITVSNGATLEFFGNNNTLIHPVLVLNGDGVTPTVLENSGSVMLDGNATFNGNVVFSGNGNTLTMVGSIGGTANLLKSGSSQLIFSSSAGYAGTTVVSNGTVIFDGGKSSGTGITVLTNAVLGGGGNVISENVTLNGGGIRPGNDANQAQETLRISGNVTMNSSSNVFGLTQDVNSGNDLLQIFGNLTMTGSNVFRVQVVDHLNAGDTYTLVTYTGSATGVDPAHIGIVPPTFGYSFALIDPTTTPNSIQIQVTQAIGFDFWVGTDPVHPTFWDTATTTNWDRNGAAAFNSNDFACFSDANGRNPNPNSTNITLVGKLFTAATIVSNETKAYQFTGSGSLSGGELILEGQNPILIANSGSNDWTNGVLIDANGDAEFFPASLYVGDGTTNGNLGFGTITNDGILVFNHGGDYSNALIVSNRIVNGPDYMLLPFGSGINPGITNMGSGVVRLAGASTFSNDVDIVSGTLVAGAGVNSGGATALGLTNGGIVYITNGGTLDFSTNAIDLGLKQIVVSGSGVNSNGAIVNNSFSGTNAFSGPNFAIVTMAGDTVIGGNSRLDWRANPATSTNATWSTLGQPFNLTKLSTNQLQLAGVTVDPALANIDVKGGIFGVQGLMSSLGNPTNSLTIYGSATFAVFQVSNTLNKVLILKDGATMNNANGTNTFGGPVTLQGNAYFDVGGTWLALTNTVNGPGTLIKITANELKLHGPLSYGGNTIISNGILTITTNVTLNNSAVIDLASDTNNVSPVIDVSSRTDKKLTIISGQRLQGRGIIRGDLAVNSGGTIAPGHSIGVISGTNNVTLGGAAVMELDAGAVTSDQINCTNQITYGGTLTVTNINGTLAAGQSFRLFRAGSYNVTTFSSVTLPTLTGPLYWTNTLASNGTIAVASSMQPPAKITSLQLNPPNLSINATGGAPNGLFYVLSSTNVSLPLSNWTAVATNSFDASGNAVNYTVTNAVSGPQRFYLLQQP
jgi:fibronectin-binding autotransporter adhesin